MFDRNLDLEAAADAVLNSALRMGSVVRSTHYVIECVRDGKVIWTEEFDNLVVNEGLNDALDKQFKASGYTAGWYVGLTGNSPTFAPGDTMASHAGWTEVTNYNAATRPALTLGSVSGGSVNNSASKASYTVSAGGANVGGAFVVANSTKGGTTGVLYGGGAFSANRALLQDDVLNVTITLSTSAS